MHNAQCIIHNVVDVKRRLLFILREQAFRPRSGSFLKESNCPQNNTPFEDKSTELWSNGEFVNSLTPQTP